MLTKDMARRKVQEYLQRMQLGKSYELEVIEESTREEDFGWVFFYNTKQFLLTRDPNWALGGNAPLIVDRATGELHVTGTAHPIEHYIEIYRRERNRSARGDSSR